jgi:hypothetical protein
VRGLIARLALLLASVSLVAVLGEVIVRSLPATNDAVMREGKLKYRFNPYRPDGRLAFSLRPGWETVHATASFQVTVRTNALGLRGAALQRVKPPGSLRILVLGDSFTFGFGVEDRETFSARLEELLSERLERRIEVLNAGVPGWNAAHYLLFLREPGLELDPDLVLVALMENDVSGLGWQRFSLDVERLPRRIESMRRMIDQHGRMRYVNDSQLELPRLAFPGSEWLSDRSRLYHWIRLRLIWLWLGWAESAAERERAARAGPPPEAPIVSLSAGELHRGLRSGDEFRLRYHRHLVSALEQLCAERRVPVEWMLIARRDSAWQVGTPLAQLHADCTARGPRCLDTLELFPRGHSDDAFFAHDPHWNPLGHDRVARALALRLIPLLRNCDTDGCPSW